MVLTARPIATSRKLDRISSNGSMPYLPSIYALPWDRSQPMFPSAGGRKSLLRPMELRSTFGEQPNSNRESPAGIVLHGGPSRFDIPGERPARPGAWFGPPGPNLTASSAFGLQPLSVMSTASRIPSFSEERWASIERFQRATATPGPGTYNPCG